MRYLSQARVHAAGEADADKRRMLKQLEFLDANYSGGLAAYISNAKRLLEESRTGMHHMKHAYIHLQDSQNILSIHHLPLVQNSLFHETISFILRPCDTLHALLHLQFDCGCA